MHASGLNRTQERLALEDHPHTQRLRPGPKVHRHRAPPTHMCLWLPRNHEGGWRPDTRITFTVTTPCWASCHRSGCCRRMLYSFLRCASPIAFISACENPLYMTCTDAVGCEAYGRASRGVAAVPASTEPAGQLAAAIRHLQWSVMTCSGHEHCGCVCAEGLCWSWVPAPRDF